MLKVPETLITTYQATYKDPKCAPDNMCNFTAVECGCREIHKAPCTKYFTDYRSHLRKTHHPCKEIEDFNLTELSPNPENVLNKMNCTRDRYLDQFHVSLNNIDHARCAELSQFIKLAEKHREYYLDRTGTVYPVPYFSSAKY
ncbi:unnamed protein product [Rodentolepis nana]|uniref:CxC6 domain-containing protein n=1 Tax=Rodentolepis nana TaxID=102285 RepID=A0A0R3TSC0_RODNA|nr:unnamed protein product [Rodentolepis nana]